MKTIKIKTYKMNTAHNNNHFFILSKGYNAGKPLEKPCPNCFIITGDNEEHKQRLFWICYSLWKAGAYLPLLCGSVIPFVRINDASSQIEKAIQKVKEDPRAFELVVAKLQQLIKTEVLLQAQVKLVAKIKSALSRTLLE